jgi:hypothetical protein
MQHFMPEILSDTMLNRNQVGVSAHENQRTLSNFVIYEPTPGKTIFLHGRDFVQHDAAYDALGNLIIPDTESGSPFTQHAYTTVAHYFDHSSLEERKAGIAMHLAPNDLLQEKLIQRLGQELPDAGIKALYDEAIARKRARRAELTANPEKTVTAKVNETAAEFAAFPPDQKAMIVGLFKSFVLKDLEPYIDKIKDETGHSYEVIREDNSLDAEALKAVMLYRARHIDEEPINVLPEIQDEITERICKFKPCNLSQASAYKQKTMLSVAVPFYDTLLQHGVLEDEARSFLERVISKTSIPTSIVDRFVSDLRQYDFDPEQTTNLLRGITGGQFRNLDETPTSTLIEAGKKYRVVKELEELATNLGNSFDGPLREQEIAVARDISEAVPLHILAQGSEDGLRLHVDRGDVGQSQNVRHSFMTSSLANGGYSLDDSLGHPYIHLSPDKFTEYGGIEAGEITPLGQLARHEYRHYWTDYAGHMGHPKIPAAVEADKGHFHDIEQALAAAMPNPAQRRMIDDFAEALGSADAADKKTIVENAIRKIKRIAEPWLIDPAQPANPQAGDEHGKSSGYATDLEKFEEVFPRVDEVVMVYGDKVAQLALPNTHRLLQHLDTQSSRHLSAARVALNPDPAAVERVIKGIPDILMANALGVSEPYLPAHHNGPIAESLRRVAAAYGNHSVDYILNKGPISSLLYAPLPGNASALVIPERYAEMPDAVRDAAFAHEFDHHMRYSEIVQNHSRSIALQADINAFNQRYSSAISRFLGRGRINDMNAHIASENQQYHWSNQQRELWADHNAAVYFGPDNMRELQNRLMLDILTHNPQMLPLFFPELDEQAGTALNNDAIEKRIRDIAAGSHRLSSSNPQIQQFYETMHERYDALNTLSVQEKLGLLKPYPYPAPQKLHADANLPALPQSPDSQNTQPKPPEIRYEPEDSEAPLNSDPLPHNKVTKHATIAALPIAAAGVVRFAERVSQSHGNTLHTVAGHAIGIATTGANAVAAVKAYREGRTDDARRYGETAVQAGVMEAAFSHKGLTGILRGGELAAEKVGWRGAALAFKAGGTKIPVIGAVIGAGFGIGETGYELWEAAHGRSNWKRVTGTFASGVVGTVSGFFGVFGMGAGELAQEGIHSGTEALWGKENAARHSAVYEVGSLVAEVAGIGGDPPPQAIASLNQQLTKLLPQMNVTGWSRQVGNRDATATLAELQATLTSNHITAGGLDANHDGRITGQELQKALENHFLGTGGERHLKAELQALQGQFAKSNWGKFIGNGDTTITSDEVRATMVKYKISAQEIDTNHDGHISGKEMSNALTAHHVNKAPVIQNRSQ